MYKSIKARIGSYCHSFGRNAVVIEDFADASALLVKKIPTDAKCEQSVIIILSPVFISTMVPYRWRRAPAAVGWCWGLVLKRTIRSQCEAGTLANLLSNCSSPAGAVWRQSKANFLSLNQLFAQPQNKACYDSLQYTVLTLSIHFISRSNKQLVIPYFHPDTRRTNQWKESITAWTWTRIYTVSCKYQHLFPPRSCSPLNSQLRLFGLGNDAENLVCCHFLIQVTEAFLPGRLHLDLFFACCLVNTCLTLAKMTSARTQSVLQ